MQENAQNNAFFSAFFRFYNLDMKYRENKISYKHSFVVWAWEQKISDDDQKKYFSNAKTQRFCFDHRLHRLKGYFRKAQQATQVSFSLVIDIPC